MVFISNLEHWITYFNTWLGCRTHLRKLSKWWKKLVNTSLGLVVIQTWQPDMSVSKTRNRIQIVYRKLFSFYSGKKCKINDIMQICRPTNSKNFPLRKTWSLSSNKDLTSLLNAKEACLGILHDLLLIHLVHRYIKTI